MIESNQDDVVSKFRVLARRFEQRALYLESQEKCRRSEE